MVVMSKRYLQPDSQESRLDRGTQWGTPESGVLKDAVKTLQDLIYGMFYIPYTSGCNII